MLTCVHSPIDAMRFVEKDEADRLMATGVWFDCPAKAKQYRTKVEDDIKQELKEVEKPPKTKPKGK
jgi:hypothetical protein